MRLSCGDHSFLLLEHSTVLDLIAALGFDGVNLVLWGERSHVRPAEIRADIAGWAGRIEERVRGRGLELADVVAIPSTDYRVLAVNHPDADERARGLAFFRDMLEFARRIDAPGLTILPGIDWNHESHEESLARSASELALRLEEAKELEVPFSIEPHVGSLCRTPADVAWLCEAVPGLQLTLDYTHFVVNGLPEAEIDPLLRHTRHFHARGGAQGRLQAPLSESTIDYERIIDALREQRYSGHIAVEYVWVPWEGMAGLDVLAETVLLRDRLRAAFAGERWSYPRFD